MAAGAAFAGGLVWPDSVSVGLSRRAAGVRPLEALRAPRWTSGPCRAAWMVSGAVCTLGRPAAPSPACTTGAAEMVPYVIYSRWP
ncbi:hypothetical protein [Streptosporangium vulgare]|uniref:hypothetical protein n=1 Tax=Streptosporangium vulgare TaxID=46190 RepID=UPI0031DB8F5D